MTEEDPNQQQEQRIPERSRYTSINNHNNNPHHHLRDSHDKLPSYGSYSNDHHFENGQEAVENDYEEVNMKGEEQRLVGPSESEELYVSSLDVLFGKTRHTIVIDDNLTANGFCQILKLKLNLSKADEWSLVLKIPKENIQRLLEDEEEVLPIYNRYKVFQCYLTIEKNSVLKKYEFIEQPSLYFAPEMITFPGGSNDREHTNKQVTLNRIASQLQAFEKLKVIVSGPLSLMEVTGELSPRWKNTVATLDTRKASECISNYGQHLVCSEIQTKTQRSFDIRKFSIFYSEDGPAKSSPEFRFCLVEEETGKFTWFGTKSQLQYQCWLTVLRLVKYGLKELSDCYRFWKRNSGNKLPLSGIGSSSSFSHSANTYLDMGQGKAIIDYTHKDGPRVIEDPKEILSLVDEESNQWRKRLDSDSSRSRSYSSSLCSSPGTLTPKSSSSSPTKYHHHHHHHPTASRWAMAPATAITTTTTTSNYLSHPWFYDDMNREEAQKLLEKYEKIDGVFLVRTSPRNPDGFVLSFVVRGKIKHVQINQIDVDHQVCWTLDLGKTKFYDIQQLIEFYQLNHTVLGTRLTHFLVHKTTHHTP